MKDTLVLDQDHWCLWRIKWHLGDEDDLGATLGEEIDWEGSPPKNRSDWEHWAAQRAIASLPGVERDQQGFWWESKNDALTALRVAKLSLEQERPMPEWALKATAEGWKPPKNWKA